MKSRNTKQSGSAPAEDLDFEIQFLEKVMKHAPQFIEAMIALAELYTRRGLYHKGLELDKKLAQVRPDNALVWYNLACSCSLVNDIPAALRAIKKAVACGYADYEYLKKDPDLANLMKDAAFRTYLTGLQRKKLPAKPRTA